jgi:hypothetical protein
LTRLIPNARFMVLSGGNGDYLGEALTRPEPELTAALVTAFIG